MTKIFILGLDGATFTIINPLIKKGLLPNLKKLKENGAYGILKSVIPPATTPAWPVFYTGKNPGKIGVYYHTENIVGRYEQQVSKINIKDGIWNYLSKNHKICLYNIPSIYPPKELNGYMVCGLFYPEKKTYTYPENLQTEIESVYKTELDTPNFGFMTPKQQYNLLNSILDGEFKLTNYLYKKDNYNLFVSIISILDVSQHFFWNFMDKKHPLYKETNFNNYIIDHYKKIDEKIGELLKKIDKETLFIVLSDHGFAPCHKIININSWFLQNNYMFLKNQKKSSNLNSFKGKIKDSLTDLAILAKIRDLIPKKIKEKIKTSFKDIDWSKTAVYSGPFGGIFLNLKGRESQGIVKKQDYENLRDELIKKIEAIRDPITDEKVIEKVYKKEEIYSGEFMHKMPDLIALPKPSYIIRESIKNNIFTRPEITANHHLEGIFIANGKNIQKGEVKNMELIDIIPTILHILNQPLPKDLDGKVIKDIFKKDSQLYRKKTIYKKIKKDHEKEIISIITKNKDFLKNV